MTGRCSVGEPAREGEIERNFCSWEEKWRRRLQNDMRAQLSSAGSSG